MKSRSKKIISICVVVAVILAIAIIFIASPTSVKKNYDMFELEEKTLYKLVIGSGIVYTENNKIVTSEENGNVLFKVEEGQFVEENQVVATIGSSDINAPFDGEVNFLCKNDDKLVVGNEIFQIIDRKNMTMKGNINESDISDVSIGQEVKITLNSSFDSYFGVVTKINKNGVNQNGSTYYEIETTIETTQETNNMDRVYIGMNGDIKIEIGSVQNVAAARVDKVLFQDKQAYLIKKNSSGNLAPMEVEVGFSDGIYIEIKDMTVGEEYYFEAQKSIMMR